MSYARNAERNANRNRAKSADYIRKMRAENPARYRAKKFFDGNRNDVAPNVNREYLEGLFAASRWCACCGKELRLEFVAREERKFRADPDAPSIDRVNNAKGYTRANIAVICWECNFRKTDLTLDDLAMFAKYIENCGEFDGLH